MKLFRAMGIILCIWSARRYRFLCIYNLFKHIISIKTMIFAVDVVLLSLVIFEIIQQGRIQRLEKEGALCSKKVEDQKKGSKCKRQ